MTDMQQLRALAWRSAWQAAAFTVVAAALAIGLTELVAPSWKAGIIFLVLPLLGVQVVAAGIVGLAFDPQAIMALTPAAAVAIVSLALFVVLMLFRLGRAELWRPFGILAGLVVCAQVAQGVVGYQLAAQRNCASSIRMAFFNDQPSASDAASIRSCSGRVADLKPSTQRQFEALQARMTLLAGSDPAALARLGNLAQSERNTLNLRWMLHDLIRFGAPARASEIAASWLKAMPPSTPYFDHRIYTDIEAHALVEQGRWNEAAAAESGLLAQFNTMSVRGNLETAERERIAQVVKQLGEHTLPTRMGAF